MDESAADLPTLLQSLGLEAYLSTLADEGVDDLETLSDLSESELAGLGFKLGHRKKLLRGLRERSAAPRLSETVERVLATYPYPIALPLSQLAGKIDVEARAKVVTRVLVQALKYQALILQSEYLLSDRVDEELNRILQKDLLRPLDSVWIKLVETAIVGMATDDAAAFAPELIEAYGKAETHRKRADQVEVPGKGYHDDSGEFVPTTARLGLVRALLHYRNDETHEDQTEADARERLEFFLGVLERLLDTFSWMSRYTLLKREDGQVWRMMGATPEPIDHPWPDHLNETGLALVAPDGERALPLFPLFVVPRQFVAEVEDDEDLLIYASNTGKRVCYSSPRGHRRELKSAMRPWRQLLEAKALALPELTPQTLTPEELVRRAAIVTRDTEDQLLASRKLLKGVYVNRPDAEVHLRPFPATSFPLALVTAQAGAGKTTLLHHMAREWSEANASVVFTRAMSIEGTDVMAWLRKELRLAASVTAEDLASGGASEERPLLLVIDGLNEHGEREALLASLLEFAGAVREARHLKVLVSWRAEYADWAAAAKDHASRFLPGPEGGSDDDSAPSLHLGPWAHEEVASLWKRLGGSDKKRFVPRFTHEDVYSTSRSLADLLKNPLLLRLLLETFHGKGLPEEVTRQGLFDAWMARLGERTGDQNRFMLDVARLLMESGSASVALDALYDDARTAEEARRTDVAAPFTRLLRREGVLTLIPGESPLVGFAMDRYMERAAGAAVVDDGRGQEPGDLVALLEELGEHPLAEEIVESALSIRVREEGRGYLWAFIDALPKGSSSSAGRIAGDLLGRLIQQGEDAEGLAAELMAEPSESDLHAAISAGRYLDGENEYRLMLDFLASVAERALGENLETEAMGDLLVAAATAASPLNDYRCQEWNARALALRLRLFGEEHVDVARSHNNLGRFLWDVEARYARDYFEKGRGANFRISFGKKAAAAMKRRWRALEHFEKSLAITLRLFGEGHADVAMSYSNLGAFYSVLGDYEQAREYFEKSLGIQLRLFGEEHADVATSYHDLGLLLSKRGEYEHALKYYVKSLGIRLRLFGKEHADVALSYNNLGALHSDLGEYEQAREYHEKALEIRLRLFGEEHADVASSYNYLGASYSGLEEYEQAREFLEMSRGIQLRLFGSEDADVATSYHDLGLRLWDRGDYEQAREHYETALKIRLRLFGEEHADVATSYHDLGLRLSDRGDYEQAREYHEKSLWIRLQLFGQEHASVALSHGKLGTLLSKLGEHEQAREYCEKSLRIYLRLFGEEHANVDAALEFRTQALEMERRLYGDGHPQVATSLSVIGSVHEAKGDYEAALDFRTQALEMRRRIHGDEHPDVATSLSVIGGVHEANGDYHAALDFRTQALEMRRRIYGNEHAKVASSLSAIGGLHQTRGDYDAALDLRAQALEMERRVYGDEHPVIAGSLSAIGGVQEAKGDCDAALDFRTKALEMYRRIYGDEHPDVALETGLLRGLHEAQGEYDALDLCTQALEMYRRIDADEHLELAYAGDAALDFRASALGIYRRIYGDEHPNVANSLSLVGGMHAAKGDYDAAFDFNTQALGMYRRIYSDEHPQVAGLLSAIGSVQEAMSNYDAALDSHTQALEMYRRVYGDENPQVAGSLSAIGGVQEAKGDYDAALDFRTQALEMYRRIYGDEHPDVASSLATIGNAQRAMGNYGAALDFGTRALVMFRRIYGDEHPEVASALSLIGSVHRANVDYDAALDFHTKALVMYRRIYGDEHPKVASSLSLIGGVYAAKGDHGAAFDFRIQSVEMKRRIYGDEHPEVAYAAEFLSQSFEARCRTLNAMANVHEGKEDWERALKIRTQALELGRKIHGDSHPEVAASLAALGGLHRKQGSAEAALPLVDEALQIRLAAYGEVHPHVAVSHLRRGDTLLLLGRREEALDDLRRCIAARGDGFGACSAEVRAARVQLAELLLEDGDREAARRAAEAALEELHPEADSEAIERARRVLGQG